MGLFASATGATMGVMCVCYSRALRKVAYFSSELALPRPLWRQTRCACKNLLLASQHVF